VLHTGSSTFERSETIIAAPISTFWAD
jgi:hypothetical protein